MAGDVVIRAEGLAKKYIIGHQAAERVPTLRDSMTRAANNFARTTRDLLRGRALFAGDEVEEFWALRDIDFEIRRGDVVGIIGRNGAGKSTLLKILSRITEPSEGRVEIRGRVASLLEVGTGFHPELTGRENIFLNGAILGMSRAEIRRKFDEIVAFAEVEKFLDTPVKRYSSGMYVRLAFAVAAHLEPEILIVDEVLAVGDAEFQKKCLGKMQDVAGEGRTVLFVSHNMGTINSLCDRGILLSSGRIEFDGAVFSASEFYTSSSEHLSKFSREAATDSLEQAIVNAEIALEDSQLRIKLVVASREARRTIINVRLRDALGVPVGMGSLGGFEPEQAVDFRAGQQAVELVVEVPLLANGMCNVDLDLEVPYGHFLDRLEGILAFEVVRRPPSQYGRILLPHWGVGSVELPCRQIIQ